MSDTHTHLSTLCQLDDGAADGLEEVMNQQVAAAQAARVAQLYPIRLVPVCEVSLSSGAEAFETKKAKHF